MNPEQLIALFEATHQFHRHEAILLWSIPRPTQREHRQLAELLARSRALWREVDAFVQRELNR